MTQKEFTDNDTLPMFHEDGTMNGAAYTDMVLKAKGSKPSDRPLWTGDYLFDFNGDLVGVYIGRGFIKRVIEEEGNGR